MSNAVDRKGSCSRAGRGPASRVREGHRSSGVESAASCHATSHERLTSVRGAVQDIHTQDVGRAVRKRSGVGAQDISSRIKGDNSVLKPAVFLVHDNRDAWARSAGSKIGVAGIASVYVIATARKNDAGDGHVPARQRSAANATVHQ